MKILIVPRTLGYGGAERQAVVLAKELARRKHEISLMPFYSGGEFERDLNGSPIRLITIDKRSRWDLLRVMRSLYKIMAQEHFDAVYTLGLGPNFAATCLRFRFPAMILFWSVRKSHVAALDHEIPSDFGWLSPKLAHFSHRVVFNSQVGLEHGLNCGYPDSKAICIPNGIDTNMFYPDAAEREMLRTRWGVAAGEKLIGVVGRIDPAKNHPDFLRAAALVTAARDDIRFICIGDGPFALNKRVQELSHALHLENRIVWLKTFPKMRAAYNAMDVLCSASLSEGFPNVIGEAMACGCPCVVTDVGDCRFLVGDTGRVVAPGDATALAQALLKEFSEGSARNYPGRQRILEKFDVLHLGNGFEQALTSEMAVPKRQPVTDFSRNN
jgi:glycosyltransferase involved in cell wall biosynthesis